MEDRYRNPSPPPDFNGKRNIFTFKIIEESDKFADIIALFNPSLLDSPPRCEASMEELFEALSPVSTDDEFDKILESATALVEMGWNGELVKSDSDSPVKKKGRVKSDSNSPMKKKGPRGTRMHSKKRKVSRKKIKKRTIESSDSSYSDYSAKSSRSKKRKHRSRSNERSFEDEESYDQYDSSRERLPPTGYKRQQEPDNLWDVGFFYCRDCHVSMNSKSTWISHINGRKHAKNLTLGHVSKAALETIPGEVTNRYPIPSPGCYRMKTNEVSRIQRYIEKNVQPCLGLSKVVEILGLEDISYYCGLCDARCTQESIIAHLQGFKHQLNCLKECRPELYEAYRYRKKSDVERKISKILREEQESSPQQEMILVEKDCLDQSVPGPSRQHLSSYASSYADDDHEDTASWQDYRQQVIPDTSKSDFYCKICDAHMNSVNMWEAHIRGKRHQKNLKKNPGEVPSKLKSFPTPLSRPKLHLDEEPGPIVGLDYVRETQNLHAGETYHCFLCRANCTTMDIIEHLYTPKHMRKYLERIHDPELHAITTLQISATTQNNLILDACRKVEQEIGRGQMEVYMMKSPFSFVKK